MPRKLLLGAVLAIAAALGLALSLLLADGRGRETLTLASGTALPTPKPLPAFDLVDERGQPFTNTALHGKHTLLFTGFATCPDVCPTTLTLLKDVKRRLGAQADALQVLFLSVDPERDTPERLKAYVAYFDPTFRAATGSNAELDKLALAMGFAYVKVPGATPATYTMDHSAALILLDPQGRVAAYFTAPHRADALAADLTTVLKKKA